MAGSRTLKLSILADVDNLSRNLKGGATEVETFGDKIGKFGKAAGLAFAAAGAAAAAYAGTLLVDGVKAAIEDEKAQEKLRLTLMNVTGATEEQIAATEDWITQQGLLYGVTDDDLRPAVERMTRATGDLTKAQGLVELAMDISAGTGKSLESVTQALGKAYEGSTTSLGKLGIGLGAAELKTMTFDQVVGKLANTFGGQATIQADTFAGRMDRLKLAFDEGKETVGSFVLDAITPMISTFVEDVIPRIGDVAESIGGSEGLKAVFRDWADGIKAWFMPVLQGLKSAWDSISSAFVRNRDELQPLIDLMQTLWKFASGTLAPFLGQVLGKAFSALGTIIGGVVDGIAGIVSTANKAYNALKRLVDLVKGAGSAIGGFFGGASFETPAAAAPVPAMPTFVNAGMAGSSTTNNITVNGAIDAEGTARTIYNVLRDSASRSGNYGSLGIAPLGLVEA
jgi:hypothetical protein